MGKEYRPEQRSADRRNRGPRYSSGQPSEKLGRFHTGITENLGQDTATEILTSVFRNGCGSTVRVPKELVSALLSHLDKAQGLNKASDLAGRHWMEAAQALTSTCSSAMNFIRGASCSARQRAITSRILGASSSSVRAWV